MEFRTTTPAAAVSPLTILVVEGNGAHSKDAENLFSRGFPIKIKVVYVSNLEDALATLPGIDGIMSGLTYPTSFCQRVEKVSQLHPLAKNIVERQKADLSQVEVKDIPNCLPLADKALETNVPIVFVCNHDRYTGGKVPIFIWAARRDIPVYDYNLCLRRQECYDRNCAQDLFDPEDHNFRLRKPWQEAFLGLMYLIIGKHVGAIEIGSNRKYADQEVTGYLDNRGLRLSRFFDGEFHSKSFKSDPVCQVLTRLGFTYPQPLVVR